MTDPKKPNESDERFAKALENEHERLIGGKPAAAREEGESEDARIESAAQVLQLLEELNPFGSQESNDREGVSQQQGDERAANNEQVDTIGDPSTKRSTSPGDQSSAKHLPDMERLGRFEIIEPIGRGGFGVVLRARDTRLDRDVALKIPRLEAALSDQARLRFEREAKAAAALSHPNLVAVYETGNEQGIDFIASEYIAGENLAAYLAQGNKLNPEDAAVWVAEIAGALEHAHQRGVLHRDMKPSNILLDETEGRRRPMIADFGLAAMSEQKDFTQTGAVLGTPAYMSPEQASSSQEKFGPTTDVYGLGTILYELLSGRSPFAGLKMVEMLDAVIRKEPDSPRSLNSAVPRDLESICLKCLEKEPAQRYASALELQADLQRFIDGKPVVARRITEPEKLLRWIKRNPLPSIGGAIAAAAVIVALVASIWGWMSTNRALQRESLAKKQARSAVNGYFTNVAENDLLDVPGLLPLREKLLQDALKYYQRFLESNLDDPELVEDVERAHFRVGLIHVKLGRFSEAKTAFEQALELQDAQLAENQSSVELRARKFKTVFQIGKVLNDLGDYNAGIPKLDEAIKGQRQLLESDADSVELKEPLSRSLRARSVASRETGEFDEAIAMAEESRNLLKEILDLSKEDTESLRRRLAGINLDQANAVAKKGDLERAAEMDEESIEIFRSLLNEQRNPQDIFGLSIGLRNRAGRYLLNRKIDEALPLLKESLDWGRQLQMMFPNENQYQDLLLGILESLGFCFAQMRQQEALASVLDYSIDLLEKKLAASPDDLKLRFGLAASQMNYGGTLAQNTIEFETARELMTSAMNHLDVVLKETPQNFQAEMLRGFVLQNLAGLNNELKQYELAIENADESIQALESILQKQPKNPQVRFNLPMAYMQKADSLQWLGRKQEVVPVVRTAVQLGGPFVAQFQFRLVVALAEADEIEEAEKVFAELQQLPPPVLDRCLHESAMAYSAIAKYDLKNRPDEKEKIQKYVEESMKRWNKFFAKPEKRLSSMVDKLTLMSCMEPLWDREDFKKLVQETKRFREEKIREKSRDSIELSLPRN